MYSFRYISVFMDIDFLDLKLNYVRVLYIFEHGSTWILPDPGKFVGT